MLKKLMLFIVITIMIVSLVGCKDNNENQNDNSKGPNNEVQRSGKRGGQVKLDRIQSGGQRSNQNQ